MPDRARTHGFEHLTCEVNSWPGVQSDCVAVMLRNVNRPRPSGDVLLAGDDDFLDILKVLNFLDIKAIYI